MVLLSLAPILCLIIIPFHQINCQEDGAKLVEIEDAGETTHLASIIEQSKSTYFWFLNLKSHFMGNIKNGLAR